MVDAFEAEGQGGEDKTYRSAAGRHGCVRKVGFGMVSQKRVDKNGADMISITDGAVGEGLMQIRPMFMTYFVAEPMPAAAIE